MSSQSNDARSSRRNSIRRIGILCIGLGGFAALVNYCIKSDLEEMNLAKVFDEVTIPEVTEEEQAMVEDAEFYERMLGLGLSGPPPSGEDAAIAGILGERSEKSSTQNAPEGDGNQASAWGPGGWTKNSPLHSDGISKAIKETKKNYGDRRRGLRGSNVYKPFQPITSRELRTDGDGPERTSIEMMEELKKITTRFYIYDNPIVSQKELVEERRAIGKAAFVKPVSNIDHVKTDADSERTILESLERHPLRTMNPNEAEIFVVPTPVSELLAYGCQWENCTWYDEAFDALSKQPTFKKTQGHKHVIIALSWPLFSKRWSAFVPALSRNYRVIENVTVAHNYDPFGCMELNDIKKDYKVNDFKKIYEKETPVTNAVSIGLGFNDPFPAVKPTFSKFENSKHFLFYHSRTDPMAFGSTSYRFAPLDEHVIEALPPSSIGFDVPKDEWVADFTSSKFCLVIRSDTPHSHALLYALRAGCIPVIVSDDYPLYAPTFKSSLAIEDFAIFIEEAKFNKNPTRELLNLQNVPDDLIRSKLNGMQVAQTMVVPSHPQSLFVPALLKEVVEAEKNVMTERPRVTFNEDYAVLSGWEFLYRYPSTLPESSASPNSNDEPIMIIGVLSKSNNFNARHSIRGTWADERQDRVFFVVAGPWEDIEDEFHEYGDLLWLNMAEDSSLSTNKVQFFLHAVNAHVESYDFVMKTTDDTYVWLDDVEKHVFRSKADYWGTCHTQDSLSSSDSRQLKYAHGMGYVLSREFNECATTYIESSGVMSSKEEIATGELAELCGVTCQEEGWDWWKDPSGNSLDFITSDLKGAAPMIFKHWWVLWKRGGWSP